MIHCSLWQNGSLRQSFTQLVFSQFGHYSLLPLKYIHINRMNRMLPECFGLLRLGKNAFPPGILGIMLFLNWNRNSHYSPKIICLTIVCSFISTHILSGIPQGENLDLFAFKISNSKTVFLKTCTSKLNLLSLQNKANWESWAEYHELFILPKSVCRIVLTAECLICHR